MKGIEVWEESQKIGLVAPSENAQFLDLGFEPLGPLRFPGKFDQVRS